MDGVSPEAASALLRALTTPFDTHVTTRKPGGRVDGVRALRLPQRGQTIGTFVERCRFVQVHASGWLLLPLHVCVVN